MSDQHELTQLIHQATAELSAEYGRIRDRAREDPGTAGDEGEENWAELLRRWLPASYHVATKGRVLSSTGRASSQVDVVVLRLSYPTGLLHKKLYLAAGVVAAFECKNTLRLTHLGRAVRVGVELRELMREDEAVDHDAVWGVLAHSHAVHPKSKTPQASISEALARHDLNTVRDPRDCMDFLCIADLGNLGGDEGSLWRS
jgi:hypothetical protein